MKSLIKKSLSNFMSWMCLGKTKHGDNCRCNYYCKFTTFCKLGKDCHFNGIKVYGNGKVTIGNHFHSGKNLRVLTTFHNFDNGTDLPYDNTTYSKDVTIEDNVWIGDDVLILGGITIGEGAVIQAGSVVCISVPPLAIAGGHPAIAFKYRNKDHYYELRKKQLGTE